MNTLQFLRKALDVFDAEEKQVLPGSSGKSEVQLRTEYEQKGKLFEKYVISRFDTGNYFSLFTGHETSARMEFVLSQTVIRILS